MFNSKKNWTKYNKKISIGIHVKYPLFLSDFQEINFLNFRKNTQISNFMKIHSLGAEFFHTDGRTDGQADEKT